MNDKFFQLPDKKQQAILNAGFRVFSQNSYKKSPMSEIADAAGISKSLLFHYFYNKRELYLFLWEECTRITVEYMEQSGCYQQKDLFDMMYYGMQAKIQLMKQYPDLAIFAVKAFYEKDEEVCAGIQEIYQKRMNFKANEILYHLEPSQFVPGLDLQMMVREMYLVAEGYLWEMVQRDEWEIAQMEKDFINMIAFWRKLFLKGEDYGSD